MKKEVTNVIEGSLNAKGLKIAVACARFNEFFVSKLCDGAIDTIVRHEGKSSDIDVAWVPGAYELPFVAKKMVDSKRYHAVIALGVVFKEQLLMLVILTQKFQKLCLKYH